VCQGEEPVPVADGLVTEIRSREDSRGLVVLGRQVELRKGQRIKLSAAAFEGQDLIFEAIKDKERIVALLSLLGRDFRVAVPMAAVVPANAL
jgi:transcriptional antiterminator RfaH